MIVFYLAFISTLGALTGVVVQVCGHSLCSIAVPRPLASLTLFPKHRAPLASSITPGNAVLTNISFTAATLVTWRKRHGHRRMRGAAGVDA